jgi:hypothetical protein
MKAHERTPMINCNKCKTDKHETEFYSRSKICKECTKQRQKSAGKAYYEANKDKVLTRTNANYYANKEAHYELCKKWRSLNNDKAKEIAQNGYQRNKELVLERNRTHYYANQSTYTQYKQEWRENNRDKISQTVKAYRNKNLFVSRVKEAIHSSIRRALKTQATPLWANIQDIENIYLMCQQKTMETGIEYHVDHIIPLKGKLVTGLHCESNLRIITKSENCRKSNKLIEEIV